MTENELKRLVNRLRKLHRAENRRAWWRDRAETLIMSGVFCGLAWLMWRDDNFEGACFGAFGLILAVAAIS